MDTSHGSEVEKMISDLEKHYGVQLIPAMRKGFLEFVLHHFRSPSEFERASELAGAYETNYGKMPPFARFLDLLNQERRQQSQAYQPPPICDGLSHKCLCCFDNGYLSNLVLERYFGINNRIHPMPYICGRCNAGQALNTHYHTMLKASDCDKIHTDELTRRRTPSYGPAYTSADIARLKAKIYCCRYFKGKEWSKKLFHEALEEAEMRGISLEQIGAEEELSNV